MRYTNEAIKRRKRAENILKRKINILIYIILIPILIYNISRISIIGYGISNDTQIIKQITDILNTTNHYNIQKIDINNGKIRITFKTTVPNSILETLHSKLVGRAKS